MLNEAETTKSAQTVESEWWPPLHAQLKEQKLLTVLARRLNLTRGGLGNWILYGPPESRRREVEKEVALVLRDAARGIRHRRQKYHRIKLMVPGAAAALAKQSGISLQQWTQAMVDLAIGARVVVGRRVGTVIPTEPQSEELEAEEGMSAKDISRHKFRE